MEADKYLIPCNVTVQMHLLSSLPFPSQDYNLALLVPCETEICQLKTISSLLKINLLKNDGLSSGFCAHPLTINLMMKAR